MHLNLISMATEAITYVRWTGQAYSALTCTTRAWKWLTTWWVERRQENTKVGSLWFV